MWIGAATGASDLFLRKMKPIKSSTSPLANESAKALAPSKAPTTPATIKLPASAIKNSPVLFMSALQWNTPALHSEPECPQVAPLKDHCRPDSWSGLQSKNENRRIHRRAESARELRAVYADSLSSSQAYNPQNQEGRTEPSQNETLRQELERNLFRPRPCLWVVWRSTLARQFAISQSPSHNLAHRFVEAGCVINRMAPAVFPVVEPECLLIHVAEKVKRLNSNVCAIYAALQQTPEIFDSLRVNSSVHVLLKMIDDLVNVLFLDSSVCGMLIRVEQGAFIDGFVDRCPQCIFLAVGDELSMYLAVAFEHSHDDGLAPVSLTHFR